MIKSPFSSRSPKDFRILQLYPNVQMSSLMPQSIGIFSALFKNEGYTDAIFDCTYYQDVHFNDDDSISEVEIGGLSKTFSYYCKFPEDRWDEIKIAEKFTPEGIAMHKKLGKEFDEKYKDPKVASAINPVM
jgi:hypothetical protein